MNFDAQSMFIGLGTVVDTVFGSEGRSSLPKYDAQEGRIIPIIFLSPAAFGLRGLYFRSR